MRFDEFAVRARGGTRGIVVEVVLGGLMVSALIVAALMLAGMLLL